MEYEVLGGNSLSVERLIQSLEKMILLHKSLVQISKNKTEAIVRGKIEELQTISKEENKHIQAVKKVENDMLSSAKEVLKENGVIDGATLTATFPFASNQKKEILVSLKSDLDSYLKTLKEQNELNQQLLEQSLQFVNLSIDLLNPDIDSFNYDQSQGAQQTVPKGRSIFDSKA